MAKSPRGKSASSYKSIGRTYDGVKVLAPKTKSKRFTEAEVRKIVARAIRETAKSVPPEPKPLANSKAPRIEKREDGSYTIKRDGKKRVSAVKATQKEAVARARELEPGAGPIVKRVRKSPGGRKNSWRKA